MGYLGWAVKRHCQEERDKAERMVKVWGGGGGGVAGYHDIRFFFEAFVAVS